MAIFANLRSSFVVLAILLLCGFNDHLLAEAQVLKEKFFGGVVMEMKVNLPADELWAVYQSHDYLKILARSLPDFYKKINYVSGDGGVGTIVKYTVTPGPGTEVEYWYDYITEINDKTKTRVQTQIQGRFRDSGFPFFASEIHVTKITKTSSIIKFSYLFELEEESLSNVSLVVKSWDPAIIVADYVNSVRSTPVVLRKEFSGQVVADMQVNLPANKLWKEYRRLDLPNLLLDIMSYFYKEIIFVNGNGEVGTMYNITGQPAYGSLHWVEDQILIDDKSMTRAIEYIKGPILDSGVTKFVNAFIIIPETRKFSVIRALGNYTIKRESLSNLSALQPFWDHGIAMAKYTFPKYNLIDEISSF